MVEVVLEPLMWVDTFERWDKEPADPTPRHPKTAFCFTWTPLLPSGDKQWPQKPSSHQNNRKLPRKLDTCPLKKRKDKPFLCGMAGLLRIFHGKNSNSQYFRVSRCCSNSQKKTMINDQRSPLVKKIHSRCLSQDKQSIPPSSSCDFLRDLRKFTKRTEISGRL